VQRRIRIARAYDPPSADDGYRVLVDRLWPRGTSKERARLDAWARTLAPSAELRKWFGHRPERFDEFRSRYRAELEGGEQADALAELAEHARNGPVTLVYGARDREHNDAVVLAELLRERVSRAGR
jgi:uncharacterized protein YeaO (DUF488 family)